MSKSLATLFVCLAANTAFAQGVTGRSPAGETPVRVRNGSARAMGRFNPQQKLRLAFGLVPPHLDEEEKFLEQLMTPGSSEFHKFLTADEWNARFAPSVADEQAVVDWAASQGLTVTHRFPNRLIVDVEATAGSIERALQVRFNNYMLDGYTYFANEREPVIPAHLVNVIRSVGGLHNLPQMHPAGSPGVIPPGEIYKPGPVVGVGNHFHANGSRARFERELEMARQRQNDSPNLTNGFYDPSDIYLSNFYNYDALKNQGHCCNPLHVAGGAPRESSIALATFGNLHASGTTLTDIVGFHTQYPYLAVNVTTVPIDGGASSCTVGPGQSCGADGETTLDAEWSTATSNSFGSYLDTAQIWVYEDGGSAEDMYNQMLTDDHARIFSTSWSCTEGSGCSNSEMDSRHAIFNQMVGQGWTLMTASGDRGATDDCSTISVSYPASDPDVIGVGGTGIQSSAGGFSSEVAWSGGQGSGSCGKNNGGSGGGCSTHYAAPGFQTNQPCGSGSRAVPDISLNASVGQNYYFNGVLKGVGGTSISSPMLAGFFAQAGAYLAYLGSITGNNCGSFHRPCTPMGNGNTYIYKFGLNNTYAPHYPFYDITSGCNSNDITTANNLSGFFCSGAGYDRVTGWGTANMLQLSWAINTYIAGDFAAPDVTFSPLATNHYFNTPQTLSWTVADASSNGAVATGVGGFSQAWDGGLSPDSTTKPTPGTGDSFYSGPQFPNATAGNFPVNNTKEGCHTAQVRTWDNSGFTGIHSYGPVCFDDIPPNVNCGAADGVWHGADVVIHCTASDGISGLANAGDASFNLTTSVPAGTDNANAFTNSRVVSDVATNSTTAGPIGGNKVDKKPPAVSCGTADGLWHASDVSIACTASDSGSGLKVAGDASFSISTSVPAGTETNNAFTASHAVLDVVGNSTTAGPVGGNMVDKKPPAITIVQPAATTYVHSATLTLNYTVTDGGSGVATVTPTMNGSTTVGGSGLPSGQAINLLTSLPLGPNTFAINAVDKVGNASSASVVFTIIVTAQSMIDDVNQLAGSGAIAATAVNSLLAKLQNAQDQRAKGNCNSSGNMYQSFINEVNAQTGKSITPAAAAILIADAQYLITHCP